MGATENIAAAQPGWLDDRSGSGPNSVSQLVDKSTFSRSVAVAAVVGPLLTLVNQFEGITGNQAIHWGKVALTFAVPFLVSTFSAVMANRQSRQEEAQGKRELAADLQPVIAMVDEVHTNAMNVNSTARARFDETHRLHDSAQQTVREISGGATLVQEALEATATVQVQFNAVIQTENQVREEIQENSMRSIAVARSVSEAKRRLSEISSLADDIGRLGHQTTLLSLNAAVVAATAGKEGRRFATIAESVRELARESEAQAKKIHTTTRELDKSATEMATQSELLGKGMSRLLESSQASQTALALAAKAMAQSVGPTKASLDMLGRQSAQIGRIAQGISKVVDHAGAAIQGSARNSALAEDVSARLRRIASLPEG